MNDIMGCLFWPFQTIDICVYICPLWGITTASLHSQYYSLEWSKTGVIWIWVSKLKAATSIVVLHLLVCIQFIAYSSQSSIVFQITYGWETGDIHNGIFAINRIAQLYEVHLHKIYNNYWLYI